MVESSFTNSVVLDSSLVAVSYLNFRFPAFFDQSVPWHWGNYRVRIHSETRTKHEKNIKQIHHTDKYSQFSSIIRSFWPNGWLSVYQLTGCGFEFSCSHLNFRFPVCFTQGVPWHSGSYRVWINSEKRTWHDKNIQSNAPYRQVLTFQLNHLVTLAKWLGVRLRTKCLWIQVQLQSLKLQISRFFRARSSLTLRKL